MERTNDFETELPGYETREMTDIHDPSDNRDLSGLSPDNMYQSCDEDELVFRGLRIDSQHPMLLQEQTNAKEDYVPVDARIIRVEVDKNPLSFLGDCWGTIGSLSSAQTRAAPETPDTVYLPAKPELIMDTSVVSNLRLDLIRDRISNILTANEISFEFSASTFKWTGMCVKGAKMSHFYIQVYSNEPQPGYLVEVSRSKGECCLYQRLFREVKTCLSANVHEPKAESAVFAPTPVTGDNDFLLSDRETQDALVHILTMAKSSASEVRLEAAKILYNMSCRDENVDQLREAGVVQVLAGLIMSDNSMCTKRIASFALAELSKSATCQEEMIESGVVPEIVNNIIDGPYKTCDTRRTCARLLANLAKNMSSQIANCVGTERLKEWMNSVDSIEDAKLLVQANRAKCSLQAVCAL